MGSTFRYVADGSLVPSGRRCHLCGRADVPIYPYRGQIVDPARARDPVLAREEPGVDTLCAACVLGGDVRKPGYAMREVMPAIAALAADPAGMVEAYHRTPDLPLLQGPVCPLCCGGLAEYVGTRPPAGTAFDDYAPWRPMNPLVARFRLADFYPLDKLPVLHAMALFRCLHCPRRYWVFQHSGPLWLGPLADPRPAASVS